MTSYKTPISEANFDMEEMGYSVHVGKEISNMTHTRHIHCKTPAGTDYTGHSQD